MSPLSPLPWKLLMNEPQIGPLNPQFKTSMPNIQLPLECTLGGTAAWAEAPLWEPLQVSYI